MSGLLRGPYGMRPEETTLPEAQDTAAERRLRLRDPFMPVFLQLLVNVLLVSVINFTVWFAITFFVYLETRSVFATVRTSRSRDTISRPASRSGRRSRSASTRP